MIKTRKEIVTTTFRIVKHVQFESFCLNSISKFSEGVLQQLVDTSCNPCFAREFKHRAIPTFSEFRDI